jgi:hypothetical protein
MSEDSTDTTQKVRRTEVGFELTVTSKRGTGVRDQDEVVMQYKSEGKPTDSDIHELLTRLEYIMDTRRQHQPSAEDSND